MVVALPLNILQSLNDPRPLTALERKELEEKKRVELIKKKEEERTKRAEAIMEQRRKVRVFEHDIAHPTIGGGRATQEAPRKTKPHFDEPKVHQRKGRATEIAPGRSSGKLMMVLPNTPNSDSRRFLWSRKQWQPQFLLRLKYFL